MAGPEEEDDPLNFEEKDKLGNAKQDNQVDPKEKGKPRTQYSGPKPFSNEKDKYEEEKYEENKPVSDDGDYVGAGRKRKASI